MTTSFEQLERVFAGLYTIESELGRGGMAVVYRGRDVKHGRDVAIKVFLPELSSSVGAERFLQEISTTASLQHPNVLALFDSGEADGILYYVMPLIAGESLRATLERHSMLPVDEVCRITQGIAAGLDHAHAHGVVHRDIKPENILIDHGQPLLADFGIALAVSSAAERLTGSGLSLGTPTYMSPEQATGERHIDGRTDIYALGAVVYEMLAGEPPFTGATPRAVVARALTERPRPIRTIREAVPAAMEAAVMKALARNPTDRYATAGAFASDLVAAGDPSAGVAGEVPMTASRPWWRSRKAVAAAGVLALAVTATAVARFGSRQATVALTSRRQLTFTGNVENVALSPDAQFVAYAARTGDSVRVLVQDTVGSPALRIAAFAHAILTSLEWSPDGSSILAVGNSGTGQSFSYLFAPLGAATRPLPLPRLAPDPVLRATWLPDGRRVAVYSESARPQSRILVVDVRSGDTTSVPLPPLANGMYGALKWSPRGDLYAVYVERAEDATGRLAVATVDGRHHFVDDDVPRPFTAPQWSPTGDALYGVSQASDVMRLRVNPRDGALVGLPQRLVPSVDAWSRGGDQRYATLSVSADGHHIGFTREMRYSKLELVTLGSTPAAQELTDNTTIKVSAVLSPDGQRAAYVQTDFKGRGDVWVVELAGGTTRQITFAGAAQANSSRFDVAWSPDGTQLAFIDSMAIATVHVEGDPRVTVHRNIGADYIGGLSWAPNAGIAHSTAAGVQRELHVYYPATNADSVIYRDSTLTPYDPVWSPDGEHLAFYGQGDDASRSGTYVMAIGKAPRVIFPGRAPTVGWTSDGRSIIAQVAVSRDLVVVSLDGTQRVVGRLPAKSMRCNAVAALPGRLICTTLITITDAWLLGLGVGRPTE